MNLFLLVNNINCNGYHDEYVTAIGQWSGWMEQFWFSSINFPGGQPHLGTLLSQYTLGLEYVLGKVNFIDRLDHQ